jgi:hypothetical protein
MSGVISNCAKQPPYPADVMEVLEAAGDNRAELEGVLSHYASAGDSLKLEAAMYLIGNMQGHSYIIHGLYDTAGTEVDIDVLDYPDYDSLRAFCDSFEAARGELDYQRKETLKDAETITTEFLLNQIEYAFRAWREKPWAKDLSFDVFREYVLPYRGSNEPLEPWREMFWEKYGGIESTMVDPTDAIEAAALINDDVKSWFTFDPRFYYHPTDQGLSEMLENGVGRCEDMTNVTIYAMRADGLAVTSDYTPHWANSGNNHAWNAIVTPDGNVTPFMGAESNPGRYRLANKLAKVYRKTFGKQPENLVFQQHKQDKVPRRLSGRNYLDVTNAYTEVCDVAWRFDREIPDSVDIAYLCVFNSGEWKAIHWGRIDDGTAVFTDMGRDIAYLPALYLDEELVPYGAPFILGPDCDIRTLRPREDSTVSVILTSTTRRKQEVSTDGVSKVFLDAGKEYELFYWRDGWKSIGKSIAAEKPLTFEQVPGGCLHWLVAEGSDREERIFTVEGGSQVWW